MTEAEWLAATEPAPMLEFLRGRASDRKRRLLAVACCRRVWRLLADARSRTAVDLAERAADAVVPELAVASYEAGEVYDDAYTEEEEGSQSEHCPGVTTGQYVSACSAASFAARAPTVREQDLVVVTLATAKSAADGCGERRTQSRLIRDIFGNPFRPVTIDPAWLTSDVVAFATSIYDEKAFDRLSILADALQDAGCDNAEVLGHCRGAGPHVRGCWVVDLLLGKS